VAQSQEGVEEEVKVGGGGEEGEGGRQGGARAMAENVLVEQDSDGLRTRRKKGAEGREKEGEGVRRSDEWNAGEDDRVDAVVFVVVVVVVVVGVAGCASTTRTLLAGTSS